MSLDEFAAQQLIYRAAFLLDAGEWETYANCFAEDGVLVRPSDPDNPIVGRAAVLASMQARPPRQSIHMITNTFFTPGDDADHMTGTSRIMLMTAPAGSDQPAAADNKILVGTFVDTLVRVDGTWLFAERNGSIQLKATWD